MPLCCATYVEVAAVVCNDMTACPAATQQPLTCCGMQVHTLVSANQQLTKQQEVVTADTLDTKGDVDLLKFSVASLRSRHDDVVSELVLTQKSHEVAYKVHGIAVSSGLHGSS